jgi:hypothetical protein
MLYQPRRRVVAALLATLALSITAGCIGDLSSELDATASDDLRRWRGAQCSIVPSPVDVGAEYELRGGGLPADRGVRIDLTDAIGARSFDVVTSSSGSISLRTSSAAAGIARATVSILDRQRSVIVARCEVSVGSPAGDASTPPSTVDAGSPSALDAGGGGATPPSDDVWRPLAHLTLVDPMDFGAAGDGSRNDRPAISAAIAALPPEGGIVFFPDGRVFLKDHELLYVRRSHTLLWARNRRSTLHGTVRASTATERAAPDYCGVREQSTIFERTVGGGVYGLRFTSTAAERMMCAETNQIVIDGASDLEIVGTEIDGSSGTGIFAWRSRSDLDVSRRLYIEGNYIHHTWADHIHHTSGTRQSWVWDNWIANDGPSGGDDAIACVTYGVDSPRCGEMEWFGNVYLGGPGVWGRGLAIIGGDAIHAHHNWIIGTSAAGMIVASEPSYDTASSEGIRLYDNWLLNAPSGEADNGHPGILVSGYHTAAPPIRDVQAIGNVIVDPAGGRVERAEGEYEDVVFDNHTDRALLPPVPTRDDIAMRDTEILRTRDTSFVDEAARPGLYRIHVRRSPETDAFEERFEYVVRGPSSAVDAWIAARAADGASVADRRATSDTTIAIVLLSVPAKLDAGLSGVSFAELRAGDRDGTLSWLWSALR